jgi:hypothetical protein
MFAAAVPVIITQSELAFDTQRTRKTKGYSVRGHEKPPQHELMTDIMARLQTQTRVFEGLPVWDYPQ